jgi:signal transduction histidine kinase
MTSHSAHFRRFERSFNFLRTPQSNDPDRHSRDLALNMLFLGTLGLIFVALAVVCVNFLFLHLVYVGPRILIIGTLAAFMTTLYVWRHTYYRLAAYSLLIFYFVAATGAIWQWGGETPVGVLLFALVIIFSGILLGARFSLYALCLSVAILIAFTLLARGGIVRPDMSWASHLAGLYDVAVFAIILGNLALVSWLFNRSMERSLGRARRSEQALRRQKQLLEVKVEERTRQVQAAHMEHVQEMYRFAELGHISVALLHDVANYLSVLSLDIEDLKETRRNRSAVMGRVQESIHHLNSLIGNVRHQVKGESTIARFNVAEEINQVVKMLEYKASAHEVTFDWSSKTRPTIWLAGSVNHFWHILTNILSNAIDAYSGQKMKDRRVVLAVTQTGTQLSVSVTDFGVGIAKDKIDRIFDPFYSSKQKGMGIGLAITKRMVEKDFAGSIAVTSSRQGGTTFSLTIPLDEHAKRR